MGTPCRKTELCPGNVQSFFSSTLVIPKGNFGGKDLIISDHSGASFMRNGPVFTSLERIFLSI